MANGGLLGRGLGDGQPFWTPLVQSDFIFTAFGEELGLTGVMALLLLYGLFVQRGLRTALLVKDEYSKLLASGLSFMFALQVFVIVGGVTRLHPAHRHHHAVPLPGRFLAGSELADDRGPRADERYRAPSAATADSGGGDDPGGVAEVNRALKRISIAVLVMFLILLVNVNYLQGFETASLADRPDNDRASSDNNQVQRGDIVTADGVHDRHHKPLHGPVQVPADLHRRPGLRAGHRLRHDLQHHRCRARGGRPAVRERVDQLAFRNFIDMITNKPQKGATVQLTINSKAQQAAYQGLEQVLKGNGRVGGRGRAQPEHRRDPGDGLLPELQPERARHPRRDRANKNDEALLKQNPSPLINNATQTTLPPGSTFKIVTSSAWYTQNATRNPQQKVFSPQPLKLPQRRKLQRRQRRDLRRPAHRPDPGNHGVRAVLQHPVREHRHRPRRPDDRRDGHQVRLQQRARHPRGHRRGRPTSRRGRPVAHRVLTRSASTTPRRRCRRRWSRRPSPTAAC